MHAYAAIPAITSQPLANGGQSWSLPVQTLIFITALGFIPALLLMTTSFTRIIIVLGLLRNALGTPTAPPNQILLGLALFMTFLSCHRYLIKFIKMPIYPLVKKNYH